MATDMTDREILEAILESQKNVEKMVADVADQAGPLIASLSSNPMFKMLVG